MLPCRRVTSRAASSEARSGQKRPTPSSSARHLDISFAGVSCRRTGSQATSSGSHHGEQRARHCPIALRHSRESPAQSLPCMCLLPAVIVLSSFFAHHFSRRSPAEGGGPCWWSAGTILPPSVRNSHMIAIKKRMQQLVAAPRVE